MGITDLERRTLKHLRDRGDNVPAAIADDVGAHRKSVSRTLGNLADSGLVVRKNEYGVYTITESGIDALEALESLDEATDKT